MRSLVGTEVVHDSRSIGESASQNRLKTQPGENDRPMIWLGLVNQEVIKSCITAHPDSTFSNSGSGVGQKASRR